MSMGPLITDGEQGSTISQHGKSLQTAQAVIHAIRGSYRHRTRCPFCQIEKEHAPARVTDHPKPISDRVMRQPRDIARACRLTGRKIRTRR